MRNSKKGLLFYTFFFVVTTLLWLLAKYDQREFLSVEVWNRYVVQICGLLGITFLTLNFVLATRIRFIENWFGGLDRLFQYHKQSGRIGFVLIWAHPFFQIVKSLTDISLIKLYFLPTGTLEYALGILALYTFTLLIILTVVVKLPYHIWKYTHKLMIVAYILAGLHTYLIKSDVSDYMALRIWVLGLVVLGTASYIYREFIYETFGPSYDYIVEKVNTINAITEVYLKPVGKKMNFESGQFAFFSFKNSDKVTAEYHPYSMSSNPKGEQLRISAKVLGDHTQMLKDLKPGIKTKVIGAYGRFNQKFVPQKQKEVWLAGGIGVTPFLSMLNNIDSKKEIVFIYACKNQDEAVYENEIKEKVKNNSNVKAFFHYSDLDKYLTAEKIKNMVNFELNDDVNILICGPKAMMKSLKKQFKSIGINNKNIIFEDFALK